jgi:hypothetical protein
MTITDLDDFKALDPFFRIVEEGLDGLADGGHFFDMDDREARGLGVDLDDRDEPEPGFG